MTDMEEYNSLLALAASFREMAHNDEGARRLELLYAARNLEIEARDLKQKLDNPPSEAD